jgi:hypothetical protein
MPPGPARIFWLASTRPRYDLSRFVASVRCRTPCSYGGGEYVGRSASVDSGTGRSRESQHVNYSRWRARFLPSPKQVGKIPTQYLPLLLTIW